MTPKKTKSWKPILIKENRKLQARRRTLSSNKRNSKCAVGWLCAEIFVVFIVVAMMIPNSNVYWWNKSHSINCKILECAQYCFGLIVVEIYNDYPVCCTRTYIQHAIEHSMLKITYHFVQPCIFACNQNSQNPPENLDVVEHLHKRTDIDTHHIHSLLKPQIDYYLFVV